MMSKVSLGGGGRPQPPSSSSSSHLSASAPPFTVDRSNSKPMQFSDFQYGSNFAHTWNFASPVPAIQNDEYRGGSELEGDSRWSSINPSAAKASMHPYFYENVPYGSTGLDNGTPLVTVSECNYELLPTTGLESAGFSSHVDYTQSLSGLDYSSQWYGLGDAKRGERAGNDCTFPFEKITTHDSHHHLKQGCASCKCGNVFVNDYCASCGLFSDSIGRESHNGLVHTGHSDKAPPLRKDGCLAYDSAWGTSSNIDPISLSLGPSMQARGTSSKSEFTDPISVSLSLGSSVQSPVKYRNPNDPYEKRAQLSGYGVNGSVSVMESFPSSLIRTPNVGLGLGLCRSFSGKSIDANDVSYASHNEVINNYNISKEKEGCFTSNPGGQECSVPVSQTKSHKVDREEFFSVFPSVLEGPSSGPQAKNTSNSVMRVKFNSQVPKLDLSIGGSFPCDTAQAIRSQDKNLDCLEHHSTVIDSPCWKGSTAFHLSPFDVVEGEATPHTKQRSEHCHMNREHDHPIKSFFGNTSDDQVGYGIVFAAADQGSRTNSPAVQASKGVQCSEYSSKPVEEPYLPQFSQTEKLLVNDSFSSTEPNMATHDNIKEGGAIAVRAAEDVLSSNSSEDRESAQPKEKSTPRLDVQMLTNSMKNISELLLSYHCSDPFALKEQNLEAIEDVISNLHALLPKKTVHLTRPPAPIHSHLGTSNKPGDYFDSHVNTDVRRTEVVDEASVNAQGPRDYQPTYEKMKNCNDCIEKTQNWQPYSQVKDGLDTFLDASMTKNIGPAVSQVVQNASVGECGRANYEKTMTYDDCGEKVPKLQEFFQIKDDLDMFGDDSMTKSLKKVLDENFNCGEEIQPLALLFKNLWLEAEARLCRFNYKARFDRVKFEMEGFMSNQMKESSASLSEKDSGNKNQQGSSSSDVLTNNVKNGSVQETVIQSSVNDPNNLEVDAAVLARLKILKGRNSTELEQSAGQGSYSAPGLYTEDSGNHGSGNGRRTCELSPGFTDKTSSEWEHVVKDDAW